MLRIGERGVARREAEEPGVEQVDVAEQRRGVDVAGKARDVIGDAGRPHVLAAERRDRLHALREVPPEVVEVVRAGEPTPHADDGDRIAALGHDAIEGLVARMRSGISRTVAVPVSTRSSPT